MVISVSVKLTLVNLTIVDLTTVFLSDDKYIKSQIVGNWDNDAKRNSNFSIKMFCFLCGLMALQIFSS